MKPARMKKLIIVGSKKHLNKTIETLHNLSIFHIKDFTEPQEGLRLGQPLEEASLYSTFLMKIKNAERILTIDPYEEFEPLEEREVEKDLDNLIKVIDEDLEKISKEKSGYEEKIKELKERIQVLKIFSPIGLRFEDYEPYENLKVITGKCEKNPATFLGNLTEKCEIFYCRETQGTVIFVLNKWADEVMTRLVEERFSEIALPCGKGDMNEDIERCIEKLSKYDKKLSEIKEKIKKINKEYARKILAAEEYVSMNLDKAEAPIHFAETEHTFVIEGWVPEKNVDTLRAEIATSTKGRVIVEELEMDDDDDVPVALQNPKILKPFENLVEMFSVPKHDEIDPTILFSVIFTIFFGFMIGDIGFGIILMIFGALFIKKMGNREGFLELGAIMLWGGLVAILFGLFVFAECFGMAFHGEEEYTWESVAGIHLPLYPMLHKLEAETMGFLLLVTVLIGIGHLMLGLIFGIINEKKHSKKGAIGRVGWLFVLISFSLILLKAAEGTTLGEILWETVLYPFNTSFSISMMDIPYSSIFFLIFGVVLIVIGEGVLPIMEIPSLLTNILSYTRIAAVAVAKGALAYAFIEMLMPTILSNNIFMSIGALILLIILEFAFVFALGSLSAGIQALRLHYVEYFIKFFEGGGTKFQPFGRSLKFLIAEGR